MKRTRLIKRAMLIGIGATTIVVGVIVASASADLLAHWTMDETTGSIANDSSGNGFDGTWRNGATADPGGAINGAIALQGVDEYVRVAYDSDLNYTGGDTTFSTWFYVNSAESDGGRLISKPWNGSGYYNYYIYLSNANPTVSFRLGGSVAGAGAKTISSSSYPAASFEEMWHHVAGVVDTAKNMTLYLDGSVVATGTHTISNWTTAGSSNTPLALGTLYPYGGTFTTRPGYFSLNGNLDDVAIWTDALDAAHARSLYTVPNDLGLAYDVADMMDLWDIHAAEGEPGFFVEGKFWQFTDSLPDITPGNAPALGDAYEYGPFLYVVLGNGTGVIAAPEPSTFLLLALGLLSFGVRRRRKRAA